MPVPTTYTAAEGIKDCEAQLAQVRARIAACLADRPKCRTQAAWRLNEQRLANLYMLEWDIRQDMKGLAGAVEHVGA